MKRISASAVKLRPARASDEKFLEELYLQSRDWEVEQSNLPPQQVALFLRQQYALQKQHYDKVYPNADRHILEHRGKAVGRLFVDTVDGTLRLIDITLVRSARNAGVGKHFIQMLQKQAKKEKRALTLHVHRFNPAKRLYESLGFLQTATNGDYLLLSSTAP